MSLPKALKFKQRTVTCKRARGLDALAVTVGINDAQFVILAPTMVDIRKAWEMLRRADPQFRPLIEASVQAVCVVAQHSAPGDELP